jgi:haloacetate dehalogenase
MFEDFRLEYVDIGEIVVRVRHGGTGPAVVLLHGHPRTHSTWYAVAPALARAGFTVVCPDLRGYGRSGKPASDADHTPYSKRAMAADVVALMDQLGHERFAVAGHDRGSYVAYRTALVHSDRVRKLVVMDGVPVIEALERCDARFAAMWCRGGCARGVRRATRQASERMAACEHYCSWTSTGHLTPTRPPGSFSRPQRPDMPSTN